MMTKSPDTALGKALRAHSAEDFGIGGFREGHASGAAIQTNGGDHRGALASAQPEH
jgi:hypothetical protein